MKTVYLIYVKENNKLLLLTSVLFMYYIKLNS